MNPDKLTSALQQIKIIVDEALSEAGQKKRGQKAKEPACPSGPAASVAIDFDKPLRPFIKQYARGLSGPKKFVLLLSGLVKGDIKKEVALVEIERQWQKMKAKSLLGLSFNHFYPAQARENDWVETKRKGFYNLRPNWQRALCK